MPTSPFGEGESPLPFNPTGSRSLRLPPEIIRDIAITLHQQGRMGTLSSLQRTSQAWFLHLSPMLYYEIGRTFVELCEFFVRFEDVFWNQVKTPPTDQSAASALGLPDLPLRFGHPIKWSSPARIAWCMKEVKRIFFRPSGHNDDVSVLYALGSYRHLRRLLQLIEQDSTLLPSFRYLVVDLGQYPHTAVRAEQTIANLEEVRSQTHEWGFVGDYRRELDITTIFLDAMGDMTLYNLCIVPPPVHAKNRYNASTHNIPIRTVTLHEFGERHYRFPASENLIIDFAETAARLDQEGGLGLTLFFLLQHLRGKVAINIIKRIIIVRPGWGRFSPSDEHYFVRGTNYILMLITHPELKYDPSVALSMEKNTSGIMWEFMSGSDGSNSTRPKCECCDSEFEVSIATSDGHRLLRSRANVARAD